MLSAKGEIFDKVLGLELGADDYIIKPFDSKGTRCPRQRSPAPLSSRQTAKRSNPSDKMRRATRILSINLTNYSVTYMTDNQSICRQRNWNFSISLLPLRIRCLPENSFSTISGAMNTSAIPVPLTSISNVFVKRSKTMPQWSLATVWGIGYKFEVKNK